MACVEYGVAFHLPSVWLLVALLECRLVVGRLVSSSESLCHSGQTCLVIRNFVYRSGLFFSVISGWLLVALLKGMSNSRKSLSGSRKFIMFGVFFLIVPPAGCLRYIWKTCDDRDACLIVRVLV